MTKIMLVEDDKSLREIYGVRLQAEGYDIKSAGDGEEALAMAIKEHPDLILSDVMMPKISGFDMLDILRATPETRDIKVIMMTALSSEDQRARGETLGANRYLVKSQVGIEDVVRAIHELLNDAPVNAAPTAPVNPSSAPLPTFNPTQTIPTPPPVAEQPMAPAPVIIPAPVAIPEPIVIPDPITIPVSTPIPQPTAPFSTPAPFSMTNSMNTTPAPFSPQPQIPIQPTIEPIPDTAQIIGQEIDSAENIPPTPKF